MDRRALAAAVDVALGVLALGLVIASLIR